MKSAFFMDGNKFEETLFSKEEDIEDIVKDNSKTLFGPRTIYFNIKNKIEAKLLGGAIPDGVLIDFKDKENPEFYLVEVELEKHDFYNHIFKQITKFFAFYKNNSSKENFIDKLHRLVDSSPDLKNEIEKLSGKKEIYKMLKDIIENSQNILLVINENKPEFDEIIKTYTDTWGKMVKIEILKQYTTKNKTIFTLNPDFENIEFVGTLSEEAENEEIFDEHFHLEGTDEKISKLYTNLKAEILKIDPDIIFNPQKYYISIRNNKNFAYLQIRRKKIRIVTMLPFNEGMSIIKHNKLKELSKGVQNFYSGPCFEIIKEDDSNLNEIITALQKAYDKQK